MNLDIFFKLSYLFVFLCGCLTGTLVFFLFYRLRYASFQKAASEILHQAEMEADALKKVNELAIQQQQSEEKKSWESYKDEEKKKWEQKDQYLKTREEKLEARMHLMEKKLLDIEKREHILEKKKTQAVELKETLKKDILTYHKKIQEIAQISQEEARFEVLEKTHQELQKERANLQSQLITETQENAQKKAQEIITTAISRISKGNQSDSYCVCVPLPSEEMKGRIIGREGRNIRALEQATGVNLLVDESPQYVVISGFDPIRKQIAKLVITELLLDGKIYPSRIEEAVLNARKKIEQICLELGQDATLRTSMTNLSNTLLKSLGKLHFCHHLGQNILEHSIEVAYICSSMAMELGLDHHLAKRIGLLHEIGKSVSCHKEGPVSLLGAQLAKEQGESQKVWEGILACHGDKTACCLEAVICEAADQLSAKRPGARIEGVEYYIKRMTEMEKIAKTFKGVLEAYALQSGKDLRVSVCPEKINDYEAVNLARDIAQSISKKAIQAKVKVTVIREKSVEYTLSNTP